MMEKSYNPKNVEDKNYDFWIDNDLYKSKITDNKNIFSIVIPPPNVTGSLHIGHALNNTLQDILVRYKKMKGFDVLWVPGMDHAGIATQMMVERELSKNGLNKNALGREKFVEKVWEWKENSGGEIIKQLKSLGVLPDWSKERFTLDEGLSLAVNKVFVDLYRECIIYRDKRLVNWDPKLLTAISDLEVEQKEVKGNYWYIKYPVEGENEFIIVATTRPETMLGDTAVAVHPDDEKYKHLVGKNVILPLTGRKIPIIADEYSDPEKGTGAVKITPAHDFNDFNVGKRHELNMINILNADATLNEVVPDKYKNLDRFDARKRIVEDLDELGVLVKVEETQHTVPYGDRSGVVIEPWLTDQWYIDAEKLAVEAIDAVENEKIKFYPEFWESTYYEWMRNIEPWCISRQLWWGHQIPAWYGPDGKIFVESDEKDAHNAAKKHYRRNVEIKRDPDVLDTWFSSGLWPFSTLGWPEQTPDLKHYYPTSCLITGFDIIFFWVARMIMLGLKFMGKVPFHDVYIHGLIRDEKGEKMSKTKGNVVDPLDVIDKYGTDALRFSLTALATQGRDIKLSFPVIEGYRNFMNKIWNASRFIFINLDDNFVYESKINENKLANIDKWIIAKLNLTLKEIEESFDKYEFDKAAGTIYHFIWGEFCDWYIELSKFSLYRTDNETKNLTLNVLLKILIRSLVALHPISPFISEEIFQILKNKGIDIPKRVNASSESILDLTYPVYSECNYYNDEYDQIEFIKSIIVGIRSLRALIGLHPSDKVSANLNPENDNYKNIIEANKKYIVNLASLADCSIAPSET
ncbi:MAG: valine--tRNA ligase, partial [Thermodesulfobacteriota bacterium]